MKDAESLAAQWLDQEDVKCREDRLSRLRWIVAHYPETEIQLFPDGIMSKYLFQEARYCFVYGQFLATIILCLAFVERSLAADFFGSGRDDLTRASISELFQEAVQSETISQSEYEQLEHARKLRNAVAHFRQPLHTDTIQRRSAEENKLPYTIIEEDARDILLIMFRLIRKWPFSV